MIKMSKFKKVIVDQTIVKTKEKKPKSIKHSKKRIGKKKQFKKLAKMNGKKGHKKWI